MTDSNHAPSSHKALKTILIIALAASTVTFAGLFTYTYLNRGDNQQQEIVGVDVVIRDIGYLNPNSSEAEILRAQEEFDKLTEEEKAKVPEDVKEQLIAQKNLLEADKTSAANFDQKVKNLDCVTDTKQEINDVKTQQSTLNSRVKTLIDSNDSEKIINALNAYNQDETRVIELEDVSSYLSKESTDEQIGVVEEVLEEIEASTVVNRSDLAARIDICDAAITTLRSGYDYEKEQIQGFITAVDGLTPIKDTCSDDQIKAVEALVPTINLQFKELKDLVNEKKNALTEIRNLYNADKGLVTTLQEKATEEKMVIKSGIDAAKEALAAVNATKASQREATFATIITTASANITIAEESYKTDLDEVNDYINGVKALSIYSTDNEIMAQEDKATEINTICNKRSDLLDLLVKSGAPTLLLDARTKYDADKDVIDFFAMYSSSAKASTDFTRKSDYIKYAEGYRSRALIAANNRSDLKETFENADKLLDEAVEDYKTHEKIAEHIFLLIDNIYKEETEYFSQYDINTISDTYDDASDLTKQMANKLTSTKYSGLGVKAIVAFLQDNINKAKVVEDKMALLPASFTSDKERFLVHSINQDYLNAISDPEYYLVDKAISPILKTKLKNLVNTSGFEFAFEPILTGQSVYKGFYKDRYGYEYSKIITISGGTDSITSIDAANEVKKLQDSFDSLVFYLFVNTYVAKQKPTIAIKIDDNEVGKVVIDSQTGDYFKIQTNDDWKIAYVTENSKLSISITCSDFSGLTIYVTNILGVPKA